MVSRRNLRIEIECTKISIEPIPLLLVSCNLKQPSVSSERVQVKACTENDDIKHDGYYQEICMSTAEKETGETSFRIREGNAHKSGV
jgi:hypothetical protein